MSTSTKNASPTDGVMRMTFGLQGCFSYQGVQEGEIYWFNNLFEPVEPDQRELDAIPDEQWQQKLLDMHRSDHASIENIIRATQHRIVRYGLYEMPVLPTWYTGRVCLVGDAAHAMGPHIEQGASMALEDAVVLATCLRDIDAVEQAFAAYQPIRSASSSWFGKHGGPATPKSRSVHGNVGFVIWCCRFS